MEKEAIEHLLSYNVSETISNESLKERLQSGKKLRVKIGVDPTRPDLHLGHAVALRKLGEFQDLGHKVIFLVGDFTAKIGDPSGSGVTRPIISDQEIEENAQTYLEQVGKILDVKKCEIRKNSEWLSKLELASLLKILSKVSVAQVIEREDFRTRLKMGASVGMHEIIYPLLQGWDSVMLKADVELGGQDQKLNLLMGRELMKRFGQIPQEILTVPLLVGLAGNIKMSKSANNYVGLTELPEEQFGKIMSISDKLIPHYLELAADFSSGEISRLTNESENNPRDVKEEIATRVVKLYHGDKAAQQAKEHFDRVFRRKATPAEMEEKRFGRATIRLTDFLSDRVQVGSKSRARRLIEQGGVEVDGKRIEDTGFILDLTKSHEIKFGKRNFFRVIGQ